MNEEEFIKNTNESVIMANSSRELKEEIAKKKQVKRTRKVKKISPAVIGALCGAMLTAASTPSVQAIAGRGEITYNFATECMDGISDIDSSMDGHVMYIHKEEVPFETAVAEMVRQGKNKGYTDAQMYIALSNMYTLEDAENAIGYKIDNNELYNASREYYLENKAEEVKEHGR